MVVKRRSFALARKGAGYTQESLAEALGVDRTTVARWETGVTEPHLWQRSKIAEALGVSLEKLARPLGDVGAAEHNAEVSDAEVRALATPANAHTLLNELGMMASASGSTWEEYVAWLTRRLLLKYGVTATALPIFGVDHGAASGTPLLAAPLVASWVGPIYEAVLHPTDAVHRMAAKSKAKDNSISLPQLRLTIDKAINASLTSDYVQLSRSLPKLIGGVELAALTACEADQVNTQRLLSDVYAVAGWTLIKADSPTAAWIAAQRALQIAEQAGDVLRVAARDALSRRSVYAGKKLRAGQPNRTSGRDLS
ncbi:MAG: helix-turn-helix transcriptional regulator [Actinomycetota bacterium]|nr:helix-turn-helix transcriptional regulator [Actinomycetota bacterium]